MKNLIITLTIVLCGLLMHGQTLQEAANKYLCQSDTAGKSTRIKTNYGIFPIIFKSDNGTITELKITVTNENPMYDSILKTEHESDYRIGKIWTDYRYTCKPVRSDSFKTLEKALNHYNKYKGSEIDAYNEVQIYKQKNKEKYIVSKFFLYKNKYLVGNDGVVYGSPDKYDLVK